MDAEPKPLDHLTLRGDPRADALLVGDRRLSFADLDARVGALAARLLAEGVREGDRVASWIAKTELACLLPLACARAGLVHVPVNPLLKRAQVAHILADSGAGLLIAGQGRAGALAEGDLAGARLLIESEVEMGGEALPPSERDPGELVTILYTSGSTGRPKGVMLSHANLWLGAVSVASYLRLATDDRTLCVLPLSFDYGQNQLLSAWYAGGCAVPLDYLVPRDVVKAVARHGITTLAGVPPLWVQLAEAAWPEEAVAPLRRITNSGGRLSVPLVWRLRSLFPEAELYSMYGLTEAFRSTYLDPALIDAHPDAIGTAIPFAEVMVVGADGQAAEEGELVHAGPLVALGYWGDAERTEARFREPPLWSATGSRAVWSGDTVRWEEGLLRFVGRSDEMIKTAGNRVSPNEIEEVAIGSGIVSEAVAVGFNDDRLGQVVELVVRGTEDPKLAAYIRRELPGFMQPRVIHWWAELPRNANGKLDRAAIRARVTR